MTTGNLAMTHGPIQRFTRTASPEALFVISGIVQYTGAVIAVSLFSDVRPATVAWLRVGFAALAVVAVTRPWTHAASGNSWSRADLGRAALFGTATAGMNLCFYLAIDRIDLGKGVVIEFLGPVAVAAALTRSRRNAVALTLAVIGVVTLSGVEIDSEPLGLLFIFLAAALWAGYIVLGRLVAAADHGLAGLGVGLAVGAVAIAPFGVLGSSAAFGSVSVLALCVLIGAFSTAIPYAIDQVVLRRIPMRRFSVLLAMLPVTALAIGFLALGQVPSTIDLVGAALVIAAVVVQERDELPPLGTDPV